MDLPPALRAALDDALAPLPAKRLAAVATDLSRRYRSSAPPTGPVARSRDEIAAYAVTRLPATYAAIRAGLEQTQARLPHWRPRALLDVGAGPGTVAWAAAEMCPDLERITLVEREGGMIALGRRLAASSSCNALQVADWRQMDLLDGWDAAPPDRADPVDLVVVAYVLGELAPERMAPLVGALWSRTDGVLLLVEPGTPAGFARIRAARDLLLAAGARTAAPCPHDQPCPMPAGDWCHFAQRVARSRPHRQAKGGELGYEDEKFAFAALTRLAPVPIAGRVIRHPQTRPGLVQLDLCTPDGLTRQITTRKDRERFHAARDLRWGSALTGPGIEESSPAAP